MAADIPDRIDQAARAVGQADALLITAGAGMGVDSGLPDFRGTQGFWRAYPSIARLGLSFEQMANPSWFGKEPHLAWAFYGHRLNLYRNTQPHPGFEQLLKIGAAKAAGYFVFTSNVDGHFQKSGFAPDQIVECHGSIHHLQCTARCTEAVWKVSNEKINIEENTFRAVDPLPRCKHCHALARPNVLMFGDWSWLGHRTESQLDRFSRWLRELAQSQSKLVVIELGAGSAVPTVRLTSERVAQHLGGTLIRINPHELDVPDGQIGLPLGAADAIRKICC